MFHILVVEDDQALNKLICRVLNKNGYETSVAFDGEQALEMLIRPILISLSLI